jgi:predicted transcriptional regulator
MVDIKFNLAKALHEKRRRLKISQSVLAKRAKTTKPKIALAEKAHESITLDYIVRSLLFAGATKKDIAIAVAGR